MTTTVYGKVLIDRQKELGISCERLAEMSGISSAAITTIRSGKHSPYMSTYAQILDCLGLKVVVVDKETNEVYE